MESGTHKKSVKITLNIFAVQIPYHRCNVGMKQIRAVLYTTPETKILANYECIESFLFNHGYKNAA